MYSALLFVFFIAVIMQMTYWCRKDSHSARRVVPWSFLMAAIINILLLVWVIIYILAIYDKDKVPSIRYEKADEDELANGSS